MRKKTRKINVLQRIVLLDLHKCSTSEVMQKTPEKRLQGDVKDYNSSGKQSWADLVENEEEYVEVQTKSETLESDLRLWSKIVSNSPVSEGFDLKSQEPKQQNVKIKMEDIKDEVEY